MSIARANAIIAMTPGADHTDYEGYFVKLSAGNPIVCGAVTDVPFGIIIVGDLTTGKDSIGVCGGNIPPVRAKLGGPVSAGDTLQLHSDGSAIVDAGSGARVVVGRALEAGVVGEKIEAVVFTPVKYT